MGNIPLLLITHVAVVALIVTLTFMATDPSADFIVVQLERLGAELIRLH